VLLEITVALVPSIFINKYYFQKEAQAPKLDNV
jgi:hypothetical protein